MNGTGMQYALGMGAPAWIPFGGLALLILIVWSIMWKGLALWHSAQRGHSGWFIALLILNTAGILEIIYLFGIIKLGFTNLFSKLPRA